MTQHRTEGQPRIEQAGDGTWRVISGDGGTVATGLSNTAAWELVDRILKEPSTPMEHRSDYGFRQSIG